MSDSTAEHDPGGEVASPEGSWLASDGRWYPPERPGPTARTPAAADGMRAPGGGLRAALSGAGRAGAVLRTARVPAHRRRATAGGIAGPGTATAPEARRTLGSSGYSLVFGICCMLTAVATFLPWYSLDLNDTLGDRLPSDLSSEYSLLAGGWGGWRVLLPALALLAGVAGLTRVVRVRERRPAVLDVVVRATGVVVLVLVVATMVARHPSLGAAPTTLKQAAHLAGPTLHFDVGWASWLGAMFSAIGVVAAFGSTASP